MKNKTTAALINYFFNWLHTASLKDTCIWFLKWNIIITFYKLYFRLNFEEDMDEMTMTMIIVGIVTIMVGIFDVIIFFLFNYIVSDRILQVKKKKKVDVNLLSVAIVMSILALIFENQLIGCFYTISLISFYFLIFRYGYTVYRNSVLLIIYATVLTNISSNSGIIIVLLSVVSFTQLYNNANKYNM